MTGLHGRAERGPHGVTVYLVPGLTACQRKAVIRRLRQEASRYVGPALPRPQLAVALCLDRARSAARIAGAVIWLHPAVTLLPSALVAALMTVFVIASADGQGLTSGQRAGLADSVSAGTGAPQAVAEAVVPAGSVGARRTGHDGGQRPLGAHAQPMTRPGSRAVPRSRRPGGGCAWPPVLLGPVLAPLPAQLACWRSASRPGPYTAHLPDPRAFAT